MSQLFEALTNLKTERHPLKGMPQKPVCPEASPSDVAGMNLAQSESVRAVETEYRSSQAPQIKMIRPAVIQPDAAKEDSTPFDATQASEVQTECSPIRAGAIDDRSVRVRALPESRLVALTNPGSIGAEKFRALIARLDDTRKQGTLRSFQVTSSMINEGKTLVAANTAITFAKYSGANTLLIEGDLHRPALATQLGLSELSGLSHWWSDRDQELAQFTYKVHDMPLWFLPAGKSFDRPSDILRSAQFARAFEQLARQFEWVVVDSTPMLPIVDVNLWSKLVDGTLLVIRQDLTPIKALKEGLQALDHPKLIGIVVNEASGSDQVHYGDQRYSSHA